jgi:F0F1-type ATP synthase membrane subunit c/vacuolar-type H+-ATPase subunit K
MEGELFVAAMKAVGAGLATIALFGVGIGIGNIFSTLISTVGRNPSVQQRVFPFAIIGFALVEAVALFALLIAFLILFT